MEANAQPGDLTAIDFLKELVILANDGSQAASQALQALGKVTPPGDKDVIEFLQHRVIKHGHKYAPGLAALVKVARQGDKDVIDFLKQWFEQLGIHAHEAAKSLAWAMGEIVTPGDKDVIDFLIARTERSMAWWKQCWAIICLGKVSKGDQSVINQLEKLFKTPYHYDNQHVIKYAIEALGTAGQSGDVKAALEAFRNRDHRYTMTMELNWIFNQTLEQLGVDALGNKR
jgi:Mn-containing catalase